MHSDRLSILFAGGGTGGHLFPALAIADEIRKLRPVAEIAFVGTRDKIEARVVPNRGYAFHTIWISGFTRSFRPGNILFPVKVMVALVQSLFLIRKLKPEVVVGTGGYVCGPVLWVASLLGVPIVVQEQNSYPGFTTRLLAPRADEVHISFESSRSYLKRRDNVKLSGNPTQEMLGKISRVEGARFFGLDPTRNTVLVFGGSLGAGSINETMMHFYPELVASGVQILWQAGVKDAGRIRKHVEERALNETVKVHAFIDQMAYAYAACDLAVCRAGATTVAELAQAGVPSILVPYPHAAADHQTKNAGAMVQGGAAAMIRDQDLHDKLLPVLQNLLNDSGERKRMSDSARRLSKPDAARTIAQAVLNLTGIHHGRPGKGL